MNKYLVVNDQFAVSDGIFYNKDFAARAAIKLHETWPSTEWRIVEIESGLSLPGYRHLGEYGVKTKLRRLTSE